MAIGLIGCSAFTLRTARIQNVEHDLIIREIAAGAQMQAGDGTTISATLSESVTGSDPVTIDATGDGVAGISRWWIGSVSGSVIIERILTDAQNVPIPEALGKLYTPAIFSETVRSSTGGGK